MKSGSIVHGQINFYLFIYLLNIKVSPACSCFKAKLLCGPSLKSSGCPYITYRIMMGRYCLQMVGR